MRTYVPVQPVSVSGGDMGRECTSVRKRERERERKCVGGKDSGVHGKSDLGLKVLRLRVPGLRSEDIIVMFCFH